MSHPALPRGVVVVGGSAGAVEALSVLVARLGPDIPVTLVVAVHISPAGHSLLPDILDRRGALSALHATDGMLLAPGLIVVAPPDRHLIVRAQRVTLSRGPRENGYRPSVDVLFRSAAHSWGPRVLGVVLSGALDDGAVGSVAIKRHGGRCVVQADAVFDGMPHATRAADDPDADVPIDEIAAEITRWAAALSEDQPWVEDSVRDPEVAVAAEQPVRFDGLDGGGEPAGYGCPDCAGSLQRMEDAGLVWFRCRVGHAWSPTSLLERQSMELESALWTALRALEEKAGLNDELHRRARSGGRRLSADRFEAAAREARGAAERVRRLILGSEAVLDAAFASDQASQEGVP